MRRRVLFVLPVVAAAGVAAATVPATGQTGPLPPSAVVHATPADKFDAQTVTIHPGNTVRWQNDGGFHNVVFDDGSFTSPGTPTGPNDGWSDVVKRFDNPGTYTYYCQAHKSLGMTGTVIVTNADGSVPTPTPTPGATPTPSPSATPAPTPVGTPVPTTGVKLSNVKATKSSFCVRKSKTCKKLGVSVKLKADKAGTLVGYLTAVTKGSKKSKAIGSLKLKVKRGSQTLTFSKTQDKQLLPAGKYTLKLVGTNQKTVKFTVG